MQRRRAESEMATLDREGDPRAIQNIDGHRNLRRWVRAQINCSRAEACRLRKLGVASDIVPGLGDALSEGHIGVARAHEIASVHPSPVGDQLGDVALLLDHAEHLSFEEFRVVTRRWETLADLDGAERNDEMSHERLTARHVAGGDSGIGADVDLNVERMESDTGVTVPPADVIAASFIGHVRRVVVGAAGVVVDAGRKRRLFTGTAREMALLLAHGCGHLGCTVRAGHCDVADGTPMAPVGRRIELDDTGPPDVEVAEHHGYRFARVDCCRLHPPETRMKLRSAIFPDDQPE